MIWLLWLVIPVMYVTGWAFLARALFRAWRIHQAEKFNTCNNKNLSSGEHADKCKRCRNNVLWWEQSGTRHAAGIYPDTDLAEFAALQALAWPVAGPGWLVYRGARKFILADPPLSPSDITARETAAAQRIKELETDLDRALNGEEPA